MTSSSNIQRQMAKKKTRLLLEIHKSVSTPPGGENGSLKQK